MAGYMADMAEIIDKGMISLPEAELLTAANVRARGLQHLSAVTRDQLETIEASLITQEGVGETAETAQVDAERLDAQNAVLEQVAKSLGYLNAEADYPARSLNPR